MRGTCCRCQNENSATKPTTTKQQTANKQTTNNNQPWRLQPCARLQYRIGPHAKFSMDSHLDSDVCTHSAQTHMTLARCCAHSSNSPKVRQYCQEKSHNGNLGLQEYTKSCSETTRRCVRERGVPKLERPCPHHTSLRPDVP